MIPPVTSEHTKSVHESLPWSLLAMISRSVQTWPCEKRVAVARESKAGLQVDFSRTLKCSSWSEPWRRYTYIIRIHKTSSQEIYDLYRFSIMYGRSVFSLYTLEEWKIAATKVVSKFCMYSFYGTWLHFFGKCLFPCRAGGKPRTHTPRSL